MYNHVHMFPPYTNFIHFENCCQITDQKSMHYIYIYIQHIIIYIYIYVYIYIYIHIHINIYYVINIQRELTGSQLYILTYTCFPLIQILSTLINCCYIADQKSVHLAQHLNASINSASCQAGKENKTGLGQGIFLLHCLFKEYISSWMQTNRIPAVSFRFWFIHSSTLYLTHDK